MLLAATVLACQDPALPGLDMSYREIANRSVGGESMMGIGRLKGKD